MNKLEILYKKFSFPVRMTLLKMGCQGQIFEDIYHDAFLIILEKQRKNSDKNYFSETYITKICIYKWLEYKKVTKDYERIEKIAENFSVEMEEQNLKRYLLYKHLKQMSESCKEVMYLVLQNHSEESIRRKLNLNNTKAVNNKKHFCKTKLQEMIKQDPIYNEIYE